MRFGVRRPSLRGRISARTSWKRYARHSLGLKAPRGYGWLTNPRKALYNRVYNRTTVSVDSLFKVPRSGATRQRFSLPPMPDKVMDFIPTKPTGEVNLVGLALMILLFSAPTLGLLYMGFSLKWAIILPIALVIFGMWGEWIMLFGQAIVGLGVCLVVLYFFLQFLLIFLHR
jgi:hypothetical protein